MDIQVTMTKEMYKVLLNGRKATEDHPGVNGCGTPEKLVQYVDDTFGLMGHVTEVIAQ